MRDGFDGVLRAQVNGATLAYREHGRGEPVVFVHGSASDMRTWEHQLRGIGASHRAIVYSRRYAPPNEPIPEGADDPMLPHVDDLLSFMKEVDAAWGRRGGFRAVCTRRARARGVRAALCGATGPGLGQCCSR
ncbi:MAG: hypothetical protein WBM47_12440 [Polyangiales bacterium]